MSNNYNSPEWFLNVVVRALLGEIYPAIRAISVELSKDKVLVLKYVLDREPLDCDFDSLENVETAISSMTNREEIVHSTLECFYSDSPLGKLKLGGIIVYARREYELDEITGGERLPDTH